MVCEAAALGNLLGLASCCLPSVAISARGQKPGQVPGEHLAFCCEEGRIRKSNAPMDGEPRGGGREAGRAWQRGGGGLAHPGGCCLEPEWGGRPCSPVGPLSPSPVGWGWPKGDGLKACQLEQGPGCQAEESAVPNSRSPGC